MTPHRIATLIAPTLRVPERRVWSRDHRESVVLRRPRPRPPRPHDRGALALHGDAEADEAASAGEGALSSTTRRSHVMHGLDVLIMRHAEAAGREAGRADDDGLGARDHDLEPVYGASDRSGRPRGRGARLPTRPSGGVAVPGRFANYCMPCIQATHPALMTGYCLPRCRCDRCGRTSDLAMVRLPEDPR